MARQITVFLLDEHRAQMAELEAGLREHIHVHNLAVIECADNARLFRFHTTNKRAREVVAALQYEGFGLDYGVIDIMEIKAITPRLLNSPPNSAKEYSISTSLTLEEIYETVDSTSFLLNLLPSEFIVSE